MNFITENLDHLAVSDAIDILIVSFILYRFLAIVQGTRAVQILSGIGALFTLYWVSLYFEFYSLNWLLTHFFDYFFVILIILFQEQFKSAIASFGKASTWFSRRRVNISSYLEEIISSCMLLSRQRTGALIVFEKQHGLLNHALTGTFIESKIHSDILNSIFQPNSPLHDGAVIIQDDKIKAAGCFLPLSKNIEIDRHMGTRHRAALGVSEVSDAVVIIVSEETGRIHLSAAGNIIKVTDEEDFRQKLRSLLTTDTSAFVLSGKGARI